MDPVILARVFKKYAELLALQVEVEGMKAANEERKSLGQALAYPEKEFSSMAEEMRCIATDFHILGL
jgi:hypothetical protein